MKARSPNNTGLDLEPVLLNVNFLLHVVFDFGSVSLALLQLSHLHVFTSKLHCLGSFRRSGIVLRIPRGLLTLLDSLSLERVSLLLFFKSLLLDSYQEFAFFSDLVADSSLLSLSSEEHCASVVGDFL